MTIKLLVILSILVVLPVRAQQSAQSCKTSMTYENRNQVEYHPLLFRVVSGIALDKDEVAMPEVCLGLFSDKKHQLIASAITNQEGKFEFHRVPAGTYRLVAKYSGFCPANTLIKVRRRHFGKPTNAKTLVLHMELPRSDHCSYGSYK